MRKAPLRGAALAATWLGLKKKTRFERSALSTSSAASPNATRPEPTIARRRVLGFIARLAIVGSGLLAFAVAALLVVNALRSNLVFFFSPSQVAASAAPRNAAFRIGGLVEAGSVQRGGDGLTVRFVVTDLAQRVPVSYRGLLPDLFREGKGVVVAGRLQADGSFEATQVLAKHDENYMPPEAAAALEQARQAHTAPTLEASQ